MKALDTGVLLSILHGDAPSRELVRRLRGSEVATTELNLLELAGLVARGPPKSRVRRNEAVLRLRRCLTVLPFDTRAAERLGRHCAKDDVAGIPPLVLGVLSTLEANGCEEWISTGPLPPGLRWPFKHTKFKAKGA